MHSWRLGGGLGSAVHRGDRKDWGCSGGSICFMGKLLIALSYSVAPPLTVTEVLSKLFRSILGGFFFHQRMSGRQYGTL